MAKFTTDYVNLIATNLRDRYKAGFPILKELVQNADDAGATSLAFGYHEGLAGEATHELLQGPALWILNNGRFRAEDRQAIQSFGLNSKAAEAGAIGKFGLGMKSVFHLCEAFFYVASDGSRRFHEILSPWFQDEGSHDKHVSWEDVSVRDMEALDVVASSQPTAGADRSWFMLWIPLRRRSHVPSAEGNPTAPIIDRYPGDDAGRDLDFFTEPGIDRRIGNVLPLLRNLERIQFAGTSTLAPFDLSLDLAEEGRRLDHCTDGLVASGSVADGGSKRERLHFMAMQAMRAGAQPFARLQASAGWPKSNAIIAPGKRGPVPDKGQPEGAVMVSHADGRRGHLSVQWAVFLPTEEVRFRYEAPIPGGSREFGITLHGQFFVDSGRRGIEGMDRLADAVLDAVGRGAESAVQTAWNQALAQEIVLPMVLPAIARYVHDAGFGDQQIASLTEALTRCVATGDSGVRIPFASTFSAHLHRDHVWIRVLRRSGAAWELQSARTAKLLPLPRPVEGDRERPWRVLPGLKHLDDAVFVDASAPKVSHPVSPWDEESLFLALEGLPAASLRGEAELKYLIEFLGMHQGVALNTERVRLQLVLRLRHALQDCTLDELRKQRQLFRQLIGFLPKNLWYGIGTRTTEAKGSLPESVYKRLSAVETRALILPADLTPDSEAGQPLVEDIEAWLRCAGNMAARGTEVLRWLDVARALLDSAGDDSDAQAACLRRHPRLQILRASDVRGNEDIACSLQELIDAHSRRQLFRTTEARDRLGLAPELARAVPDLHLLVVSATVAGYVQSAFNTNEEEVPSASSAEAMFRCIGEQTVAPALSAPGNRLRLLNHVGSVDNLANECVRRGVRYLLHDSADHFRSHEPLWKDPAGQNSAWTKLWRMVVDDTWNVLPGELSDPVPDKCSKALDIRSVDRATVIARLKTVMGFDAVIASAFTQAEIDTILGQLDDETAWRRLPLHRDTEERFGPANGMCWLGMDPQLPRGFETSLRFIGESNDDAHLRRQRGFLPAWTAATAAAEVLGSHRPHLHWRYLLDLLPALGRHAVANQAWQNVAWLPLKPGGAISPASVVRIDEMANDIARLAVDCNYAYAGLGDLSDEVRNHPAFDQLLEMFPYGSRALPILALMMASAGLSVGRHADNFAPNLVGYLGALADIESLPAWALLARAACATTVNDVELHVLGNIVSPLSCEHALQVLAELAKRPSGPLAHSLFLCYLKEWAASAGADELRRQLPLLRLPAADGKWHPASKLAHGAFGVVETHLVDPEVGRLLAGIIVSNLEAPEPVVEGDEADAVEGKAGASDLAAALEKWSEPFAQSSVRPAVGALLGLFGGAARELAESLMAPIAYDDYLFKLNWKDPGYESGFDRRRAWMGGHSTAEKPFSLLKPVFVVERESAICGLSLTGEELLLPLASGTSLSTLVAGSGIRWLPGNAVEIRMRPIECLSDFDHARRKAILQETAEILLSTLYNQKHANLTDLWKLFEDADQVELDVARTLILEGLPQLMKQLSGVKRNPLVDAALKAFDKARRAVASASQAHSNVEVPRERVRDALRELERLVENDASVQETLLAEIRSKVEGYQYETSSIPFELLQNADDAVSEYQAMQEAEGRQRFPVSDIGQFVAMRAAASIVLIHWGRPINHTGRGEGYRAEYEQDLERMLMLGASAKELGEGVTGKFGLGFKSVLLASDNPVVESGDLRFDIVAGCLPRRARISAEARTIASLNQRGALRPTIVELPMAEGGDVLLRRFSALAGLCTVLSRQIRHITTDTHEHVWQPERLLEASGAWCELGRTHVPFKDGLIPTRLLVFRCAQGAAAVRLDGNVVPFDDGASHAVPAVWVHAPTRGTPATGIVLNADFHLDTGRGSLPQGAAAQRNQTRARQVADRLAPVLSELVVQSRSDWAAWSTRLAAGPGITAAAFWHAFWNTTLVAEPDSDASQDARLVAAHAARLFDQMMERTNAIPNGLPGDLCDFAVPQDLRLAIRCERLQQVLPLLLQWPAFLAAYPAASWCSLEVRDWLPPSPRAEGDPGIVELDRGVLLQSLGMERRLRPEDLETLVHIMHAWPQGPTEVLGWKNELALVHLRSQSGAWKPVAALCMPGASAIDPLAGFVPDEILLDPRYEEYSTAWSTIRPYLASRILTADELARWCLDAASTASRLAVVDWLSANLDAYSVWSLMRAWARADHWILELHAEHTLLARLDEQDRSLVLTRLGMATAAEPESNGFDTADEGTLDLDVIHAWWLTHRHDYLPAHDKALWPQRVDRMRLADEVIDRDTWMTLFSLGVFRRFGRVRNEQNRAFLDFLHSRGWWETITLIHPDQGPDQWMLILREYAEASQVSAEFEQWMDSFPRLYRVARWYNDYVDLFLGLDQRSRQEARHLLTPGEDHSLSGSGIDAPTLRRTLHVGHNLVIRELLRAGVLQSEVAQGKAFMPGQAMLDFLAGIGYPNLDTSEEIHAMLVTELGSVERASFCGDYDIPLTLLAQDPALRHAVLAWAADNDEDEAA